MFDEMTDELNSTTGTTVMTLTEENRQLILGALDSLGTALVSHGHEWSEGERTIYEMAVECVCAKEESNEQ